MRRMTLLVAAAPFLVGLGSGAQASGFGMYFARVTAAGHIEVSSGGLPRSSGVAAMAKPSTGVYEVTFNRNVNYCAYVATVTGTTPGYATIDLNTSKSVTVTTFGSNGAKANRSFNVIVSCAP